MVQKYPVFGKQVGSHHLAMGVLASLFGGTALAMRRGGNKASTQAPPVNASSSDEADFIKQFIEEAEAAEKKMATKH